MTISGAGGGKVDLELFVGRIILNGFLVSDDRFVPAVLFAESNRAVVCVDCSLDILLGVGSVLSLGFLYGFWVLELCCSAFGCVCFSLFFELFFFAVVQAALEIVEALRRDNDVVAVVEFFLLALVG